MLGVVAPGAAAPRLAGLERGRTAYRARLWAVLRSKKTQGVAGRIAAGLLKVCKEVVKKKGAASRG